MYIQRSRDRKKTRIVRFAALLISGLCLSYSLWGPGVSYAGKEGVFLSSSVYFTLENTAVSVGSDTQTMRFDIRLNNDGDTVVDFNRYGVRVSSASGYGYYAELSQASNGQVGPHSASDYDYVAHLPAGLAPSELKVTLFERSGDSLRDIGSLSVAAAQSVGAQSGQLLVNLADADSAITKNTYVQFRALKAIALPQDGKWTVLVDAEVSPTGKESVPLPAGLHYILHDGTDNTIVMTPNAVDGSTIAAGQSKHVLLTAVLDAPPSTEALTLELSADTSGTSSFGKLPLASLFTLAKTGQRVPYVAQGRGGITLELQKAEAQTLANKPGALITVALHNDSQSSLQTPSLQGTLIAAQDVLSVSAETVLAPDTYIAPGETGIYRFAVQLPDGVSAAQLQFAVSEPSATSMLGSAGSASSSSGASTASGASGTAASTDSTTTIGSAQTSGSQSASSAADPANRIPVLAASLDEVLATDMGGSPSYELGQAFAFDSASRLIDPNLEVSVVELSGHTNADNGYRTVVAKFKFLNKSGETLELPTFDTSLTDASGTSYPGTRQTTALQELIPNSAYVYSYSYMLPPAAAGTFKLSLLDASNASKIKVPIANYQVTVSDEGEENPTAAQKTLSFYPFNLKIDYWSLDTLYNSGTYTYRLKLELDIQKEAEVIVDDTFSTLEFELVDANNRVLGSTTQQLQGTNKLISGMQTVDFTNIKTEQFEYPLTVHIYEDIATASGTAKRLIGILKQ